MFTIHNAVPEGFNEKTNTADLIFKKKFIMTIPAAAMQSDEALDAFGVINTPKLNIVDYLDNSMVKRYMTIAQMVNVYKQGYKVTADTKEVAKDIYDSITYHLYAWKNHLDTSINTRHPPVDDLVTLDEIAQAIFSRYTPLLVNNISEETRFKSPLERIGFKLAINKHVKTINYDDVEREGYSDTFMDHFSLNDIYPNSTSGENE